MEKEPLVSVVIPTYKRPKKLNRALKSVINQTYNSLEIIIVNDDPETDLDNITELDDKIKLINHKENRGAPAARNTGIKNSSGKYIAFLDDDDKWLPKKIEKQIKLFKNLNKSYGVIYTWSKTIKGNKNSKKSTPTRKGNIFEDLLEKSFIRLPTVLIKKNCFQNGDLFDEKMKSCQDTDLFLRLAKKYKFSYVPEILVEIYQTHSDRITTNIKRRIKGSERLISKHKSDFERHPKSLHRRYKLLGVKAAHYRECKKTCLEFFKKSFFYNRKDLLSIIYYLISYFPQKIRKNFFKLILEYYEMYE